MQQTEPGCASASATAVGTIEFSDVSKAIEEATGIEGIDLFPGIRKWQVAKQAEKAAAAIPPDIRGIVVRKLVVSILTSLFRRKG